MFPFFRYKILRMSEGVEGEGEAVTSGLQTIKD